MSKELSKQQQSFLDYVFQELHESGRSGPEVLKEALVAAGYGPTMRVSMVLASETLKDAIYSKYKEHMAIYGLEAMSKMIHLMRNPNNKDWRAALGSAQAVMDASALPIKVQETSTATPHGIVLMPGKNKVTITVDEDGKLQEE